MYLPGYVMDGWWNHHGVINQEVRYLGGCGSTGVCDGCMVGGIAMGRLHIVGCSTNRLGIRGGVCLPGCGMVGRITMV